MKWFFIIFISVLASAASNSKTEINRMGKSCQICITTDNVEVCRFYKVCPIKEDKNDKT